MVPNKKVRGQEREKEREIIKKGKHKGVLRERCWRTLSNKAVLNMKRRKPVATGRWDVSSSSGGVCPG